MLNALSHTGAPSILLLSKRSSSTRVQMTRESLCDPEGPGPGRWWAFSVSGWTGFIGCHQGSPTGLSVLRQPQIWFNALNGSLEILNKLPLTLCFVRKVRWALEHVAMKGRGTHYRSSCFLPFHWHTVLTTWVDPPLHGSSERLNVTQDKSVLPWLRRKAEGHSQPQRPKFTIQTRTYLKCRKNVMVF